MAKRLQFGNVVLCEHAVPGLSSKHTLVGVYAGDILLQSMPADMTFGLYIEVLPETLVPELTLTLSQNGEPFAKLEAQFETSAEPRPSILLVPLIQAHITVETVLEITAEAAGYARTLALRKRISVGSLPNPSPIASPPPSEQSRPASRKKGKRL